MRKLIPLFLALLATASPNTTFADDTVEQNVASAKTVYAVRLDGPIGQPNLFILRRALKEAIDTDVDVFLLDLNTPGGEMDAMMETMEALANFPGKTVTYVNSEAISAGSYIASVTDEIWFAPNGIMGAADVISGDGNDLGETLKLKIHSYIDAKVRVLAAEKGRYREQVQRAMMDANFEFKIGDTVIKSAGELLSLTAAEAGKTYGEPPVPLLSAGTSEDLSGVISAVAGKNVTVSHFEKNWAEHLALLIQWASPVLLALAALCVLIEYKTPGFGFFGISAAVLFFVVFAGNYAAGLAGYEPLLLLLAGFVCIVVEALFFPGMFFALTLGIAFLLVGLVWSMLDVWPKQDMEFTPAILVQPFVQLGLAAVIFVIGAILSWNFLPKKLVRNRLILDAAIESEPVVPTRGADFLRANDTSAKPVNIGDDGVAITDLRPGGVVQIAGTRYNAAARTALVERGSAVTVRAIRKDELLVEAKI